MTRAIASPSYLAPAPPGLFGAANGARAYYAALAAFVAVLTAVLLAVAVRGFVRDPAGVPLEPGVGADQVPPADDPAALVRIGGAVRGVVVIRWRHAVVPGRQRRVLGRLVDGTGIARSPRRYFAVSER